MFNMKIIISAYLKAWCKKNKFIVQNITTFVGILHMDLQKNYQLYVPSYKIAMIKFHWKKYNFYKANPRVVAFLLQRLRKCFPPARQYLSQMLWYVLQINSNQKTWISLSWCTEI